MGITSRIWRSIMAIEVYTKSNNWIFSVENISELKQLHYLGRLDISQYRFYDSEYGVCLNKKIHDELKADKSFDEKFADFIEYCNEDIEKPDAIQLSFLDDL